MSVKRAASVQLERIVDAAVPISHIQTPALGWIKTVRLALRMSGPQLAKRLGVTRARVSALETSEADGAVTLRSMKDVAAAMGCRFVYAIIPEQSIRHTIEKHARTRAQSIVRTSSTHMALEDQALTVDQRDEEIDRIAHDLIQDPSRDFWDDP